MVSHADIVMYLTAIKSFVKRFVPCGIVVLNDGTLTPADVGILQEHIIGVEIIPVASISTGRCPRGGCWERLLAISDLAQSNYVVQLDSDTLTLGSIGEITDCVANNRSFVLGTAAGRSVVTLAQMSAQIQNSVSTHIQVESEKAFRQLPYSSTASYIRGSAGFSGFARGSYDRLKIEAFSADMEQIMGNRWHEWGTEQMTSNFVVANSRDPLVLPSPDYSCFEPHVPWPKSRFLHFIGSHRFSGGVYTATSREFIASC